MKYKITIYFLITLTFGYFSFTFANEKLFKASENPKLNIYVKLDSIEIEMSSNQFRILLPTILPDKDKFNGKVSEKMNYEGIDGTWTYYFIDNMLMHADYRFNQILNYSDYKENKSKIKKDFTKFYKNSQSAYQKLITLYGKPESEKLNDSTKLLLNGEDFSVDFINSTWRINDLTIHLISHYEGRRKVDPSQNNINANHEPDGFEFTIRMQGIENTSQFHFQLGETAQNMEQRKPELFENGTGLTGSFAKKEKLGNIDGTWSFCFKNSKLKNANYDYYFRENGQNNKPLTEKSYSKLMNDYRSVKTALEVKFGKPTSGYDSIPNFSILEQKKVVGEDFMNYEWKFPSKIISLELRHHYGGKGFYENSFFFDVNITDVEKKYKNCY